MAKIPVAPEVEEAEMAVVVAEPPALIDQLKQQKVIAAKIRKAQEKK